MTLVDRQRPHHDRWLSGAVPLAVMVFVLAMLVSGALVWRSEQYIVERERARAEQLASTHAVTLQRNIERALAAAYSLAALVRQAGDMPADFDAVATKMLGYYPGASALALAPDGVVRRIVPLPGNERALGHDLLKDPARDKEAFRARDTGELTLAGPFDLVQGGVGAAGRLPVYLGRTGDRSGFWGFVSVLIRFPEVLAPAGLEELPRAGYDYVLWRTHPDTRQRQVIAGRGGEPLAPVDIRIDVPNAIWTLSVAPAAGWGNGARLGLKSMIALACSLFLAFVVRFVVRERDRHRRLEAGIEQANQALRQREDEQRRTEAFLSSVFEVAPVGITIAGPDGAIVHANRRAIDILGLDMNDLAKRGIAGQEWRMVRPDGTPMPVDEFASVRAMREGRGVLDVEMGIVHDDGIRWVVVSAVPSPDPRYGVIIAYADITERRQSEALRDSETHQDVTGRKRAEARRPDLPRMADH